MYGGQCCSEYTKSMLELKGSMEKYNHQMTGIFVGNESLIPRARNKIAHIFLTTDASHLLFMDGDQSFEPRDIVKLIKADKDIIVGIVPMKGINWERVRQGALKNHNNLEALTGIFNIRELPGHQMSADPLEPFQILYGGSGYMLIHRSVFEKLAPTTPTYSDRGGAKVHNFFSAEIVGEELLSEDFLFCHKYREIGGTVWAAPWCQVGHFGSYHFKGDYITSTKFDRVSQMEAIVK
jgi:hypothetical protein